MYRVTQGTQRHKITRNMWSKTIDVAEFRENSFVARYKIPTCRTFNPPNPRRKEARPRWLKYDGLPHSDRSIFHEDMTKERCRMTLRRISVNQSLSRYKRPSSDFMKLEFSFDILSESIVPSSLEQSRRITKYVCFARNIGGLINRLSAFI